MTRRTITIKEVARAANVGVSTASRALGDYGYIGEETKKNIREVAKRLGYQQSSVARSLRTNKTQTIGYILPDITNPFYARIARGIQDVFFQKGYHVILGNSDNDTTITGNLFNMFFRNRVEGIIFSLPFNQALGEMVEQARCFGIPVINCYGTEQVFSSDCITVNSETGCYRATKHLLELGHRLVCVLKVKECGISQDRFRGCLKALESSGIEPKPEFMIDVDQFSVTSGHLASKLILSQTRKPSAIVALNEQLAIGVMQTVREENILVPGALSLVSVNDGLAAYLNPPLTSVSIPSYQLGRGAASLLINRLDNNEPLESRRIELSEELVVRESTGRVSDKLIK